MSQDTSSHNSLSGESPNDAEVIKYNKKVRVPRECVTCDTYDEIESILPINKKIQYSLIYTLFYVLFSCGVAVLLLIVYTVYVASGAAWTRQDLDHKCNITMNGNNCDETSALNVADDPGQHLMRDDLFLKDYQSESDLKEKLREITNTTDDLLLKMSSGLRNASGTNFSFVDDDFVYAYNMKVWEKEFMNMSVNPCEDFYAFACGSAATSKYYGSSFKEQMGQFLRTKAVEETSNYSYVPGYDIYKVTFEKCIEIENYQDEFDNEFMETIRNFGGWHINEHWNISEWNVKDTLTMLISKSGFPLLKAGLFFHPGLYGRTAYAIILSFDKVELKKISHQFIRWIKIFHRKFAELSKSAVIDLPDEYYDSLNEMLKISDSEGYNFKPFDDFELMLPNVDMAEYVKGQIPLLRNASNLDISQVINFVIQSDISNFTSLLNTKSRELNDFLIFMNFYEYIQLFEKKDIVTRKEECFNLINDKFPLVYSQVFSEIMKYSEAPKFRTNHWKEITNMSELIRSKIISRINASLWISQPVKDIMIPIVQLTKFLDTFHDLDSFYGTGGDTTHHVTLPVGNETLLAYLMRIDPILRNNHNSIKSNYDKNIPLVLQEENIGKYINKMNAYHIDNKIIITQDNFGFSYYEPKLNYNFIDYGVVGSTIAHEFAHALFLNDLLEEKKEMSYLEEASQCLEHHYTSYKYFNSSVNGKQTLDENIADIIGISLSFEVFEEIEKDLSSSEFLSHDLPPNKHFFLSYAQSMCEISNKNDSSHETNESSSKYGPWPIRVNGVLSQTKEFRNAYNCKAEDAMVASTQCPVLV